MTETCNILVSSAGRRVALVEIFRETLATLGVAGEVLATDASRLAAAFHHVDRAFQVPLVHSDEYMPTMLDLCQANQIKLIVPTIDEELAVLAGARQQFEAIGTRVAISAPETIAIGADKRRTHDWLLAHGFPTVTQVDFAEAVEHLDADDFPVIVKPARGSASIGVRRVSAPDALIRTDSEDLVVQSLAPGVEHTVDVFVDCAGDVLCTVPRRRLEVRGGEVSKGVTVRCAALEALAADIAGALPGAYGALNVQAFVDESEHISVIEINARFGGGYPLSWTAGAPFPMWLVAEILGRTVDEIEPWREGVVMLRYDDAVFVDASAAGL